MGKLERGRMIKEWESYKEKWIQVNGFEGKCGLL